MESNLGQSLQNIGRNLGHCGQYTQIDDFNEAIYSRILCFYIVIVLPFFRNVGGNLTMAFGFLYLANWPAHYENVLLGHTIVSCWAINQKSSRSSPDGLNSASRLFAMSFTKASFGSSVTIVKGLGHPSVCAMY